MKRKTSYLPAIAVLIAFSFLLMTVGCNKSSSPSGSSGAISVSFNGTAFQPLLVVGLDDGANLTVAGLQVKSGDSISVAISFPDDAAINTPLSFSSVGVSYSDSKGNFDFESLDAHSHGTLTITALNKTNLSVAGTFSGVLYDNAQDSVVITNGQFNTTYKTF